MTKILALDASSDACSVALLINGQISESFSDTPRQHTRRLLPMIDALLQSHALSLGQLDAIAYGSGPGSFTGLRICLGIAQGLAFGAELPLVPVSTLEAMALACIDQHGPSADARIMPALDARMGEIYWSEFRAQAGMPVRLSEDAVTAPDKVVSEPGVIDFSGERFGVGEGWHYPALAAIAVSRHDPAIVPRASCMARLAQPLLDAGQTVTAETATPVYLRDSVAWQKRVRIRTP